MTDLRTTTKDGKTKSQDQDGSPLDDVLQKEVLPVKKRDRRLATLFFLIVCVVIVAFSGWSFLNGVLVPEASRQSVKQRLFASQRMPMPERLPQGGIEKHEQGGVTAGDETQVLAASKDPVAEKVLAISPVVNKGADKVLMAPALSYNVTIGPFVTSSRLQEGEQFLAARGLSVVRDTGSGPIKMIRLREGIYAPDVARKRVEEMKQAGFKASFVLPAERGLAVYAGSFIDQQRAEMLTKDLENKNIKVAWVDAEVQKEGTLFKLKGLSSTVSTELEQQFSRQGVHVQKDVVK